MGKWFRWAWAQVYGGLELSEFYTTLTADAFTFTGNGTDDVTFTLTTKDESATAVPNVAWTATVESTLVSASLTTLETDDADIETTTGLANITAYLKDSDGYAMPNISAAQLSLSSTGSNNTITAVDSVSDANGRFRWTFESTTAETKTLSLTACSLAITDTVQVVVGTVGALTPIFQSDFSTATGTGSSAYLDGGAWDRIGGYGHEVVASTGLDFPSTNVCQFNANYANSGFCLTQVDLDPLDVGVARYHRLYVRMEFPDELVGNGDHPWQDGNAVGDSNYLIGVHYGSDDSPTHDGDWQIGVIIIEDGGSITFDNGPWLTKGVTYRVEWMVDRISTTEYNFEIRVYDTSGTLLYDETDFPADFGGGTLATRGPYEFKAAQEASPGDFFNCGTNDFETAGNDWWNDPPYSGVFNYGYQGCFAICEDQGWIGAYGSVTGE